MGNEIAVEDIKHKANERRAANKMQINEQFCEVSEN
jgi:hypothetical protein